jgi:hypothetical protein
LDFVLPAGDFDHDLFGAHIDDPGAEDFCKLSNFTSFGSVGCRDLDEHQVAFDIVVRTDVLNRNDRDDLFELLADLGQDPIVTAHDERHSRETWDLGFAYRKRINVVSSRSKHSGNVRKNTWHILNGSR